MRSNLTIRRNPLLKLFIAMLSTVAMFSSAFADIPKYNSNHTAIATVYLDFDGQVVKGTSWNWDSTIHAQPARLSTAVITQIFNRVAEDYRIFNINITTDSAVFAKAPATKRIRILVTPTSHWYGVAGGISFVGSFTWGDDTPAWVFTDILQNNPKYIGEACSHETGHTLGLQHQSTYDKKCGLVTEYAEGQGTGEIGWAPIMGVSYYKNQTTWNIGTSIEGCNVIQNDIAIMSKTANIGCRSDDHGNTIRAATPVTFYNDTSFGSSGIINNATDVDVFKMSFSKPGILKVNIVPGNVGKGDDGANLDIKISLLKSNGDTIGRYNPKTLLSASIDTTLISGTYYMAVEGVANQNAKKYNSLGSYTISGNFKAILPIKKLTLKGSVEKNGHLISWAVEANELVISATVECSRDDISFKTMAVVSPSITSYRNNPLGKGSIYYRIKMFADGDDTPYYSNVVSLDYSTPTNVELMGNMIRNTALINVSGNYNYDLMDAGGRVLQRGRLTDGFNNVQVNAPNRGLLLLKVYNANEQTLFKLMKE